MALLGDVRVGRGRSWKKMGGSLAAPPKQARQYSSNSSFIVMLSSRHFSWLDIATSRYFGITVRLKYVIAGLPAWCSHCLSFSIPYKWPHL
jgi:hypothetical protein